MFLKTFKRSLSNASHKNTLTSNHYSKRLSNSGNYSEDWKKLREERLRMDNYICQKCGFDGHKQKHLLNVHHKVALSRGGRNKLSNLITLCKKCHDKVHHKQLVKGRR